MGRWRRGFRAGRAVSGDLFGAEGLVVAGLGRGAALAESAARCVLHVTHFAVVVDAFAALRTDDAGGFVAGHLAGVERNADPLFAEEVGVGKFAVGEHLLLVLVFDVWVEFAGALLGGFEGGDADGACRRLSGEQSTKVAAILPQSRNLMARLPRRQPVTTAMASVAQRSISTKVTRRLRSAALVVDAEALAAEHGHADAENLPGAEMAVSEFGFVKEGVKGLHGLMIRWGLVARVRAIDGGCRSGGSIRCPRCVMSELATTIGAVLKQKPRQVGP